MILPRKLRKLSVLLPLALAACAADDATLLPASEADGELDAPSTAVAPLDPDRASSPVIDRFSAEAGMLQVRDASNGLPGPGETVDFDQPPFITRGLGPLGQSVRYYNFDVQPTEPAPIYVLFRAGENAPVEGQLNIVDAIPGEPGYSDFWRVTRVTVPADYVVNSVTSLEQIRALYLDVEVGDMLVNCPVVPDGSTARLRLGSGEAGLTRGWYRGQVVHYFGFTEHPLRGSVVPVAPIYVTFNVNPDQQGGGPASGFRTEEGSAQTHNVVAALPGDDGYSPLWSVNPYDNGDFAAVMDLGSALGANVLAEGVATVNCPVVDIAE